MGDPGKNNNGLSLLPNNPKKNLGHWPETEEEKKKKKKKATCNKKTKIIFPFATESVLTSNEVKDAKLGENSIKGSTQLKKSGRKKGREKAFQGRPCRDRIQKGGHEGSRETTYWGNPRDPSGGKKKEKGGGGVRMTRSL